MSHLHLITGCMFSGKTSFLMGLYDQLPGEKLVIKPLLDSRSRSNKIENHNSQFLDCIDTDSLRSIDPGILERSQHLLLDEVQFFERNELEVIEKLLRENKFIYTAGLYYDFRNTPFEIMPDLKLMANSITELFARCEVCGSPATHTYRTGNNMERYLPGGSCTYQARCAACFNL